MEEEKKSSELKEVTKEILGWEDNKLFRTLHHLTTRPGQMITMYCKGVKGRYLSPVIYFFGVEALDYFLNSISGFLDFITKSSSDSLFNALSDPIYSKLGINTSGVFEDMNSIFSFFISETGQKITQIPILLLATWLFYKKYNKSFKENSWFALYTTAHIILLSIPLTLYWYFTKDMILNYWVSLIILLGYWIWASMQFYNLKKRKAIVLGIFMMSSVMVIMTFLPIIMVIIMQLISF